MIRVSPLAFAPSETFHFEKSYRFLFIVIAQRTTFHIIRGSARHVAMPEVMAIYLI